MIDVLATVHQNRAAGSSTCVKEASQVMALLGVAPVSFQPVITLL